MTLGQPLLPLARVVGVDMGAFIILEVVNVTEAELDAEFVTTVEDDDDDDCSLAEVAGLSSSLSLIVMISGTSLFL
jgi:hypothetical protein